MNFYVHFLHSKEIEIWLFYYTSNEMFLFI